MSYRARIRTTTAILALALAAAFALLSAPTPAHASTNQLGLIEDDATLFANPTGTLDIMRLLGAGAVRVAVRWSEVSPDPTSTTAPAGFNPSDPGSYPAGTWDKYDQIVNAARARGIQVLFVLSGPAPLWATGPGQPSPAQGGPYFQWRPNPALYGAFVKAVATRYNGGYHDPVAGTLPRVHTWEIWNEPNWGQDLAPQAPLGSSTLASPAMYRGLLNAGWQSLQSTSHGHDTILVGSLSPRGHSQPGNTSASKPLTFVRALYCVDNHYRPLRGGAAAAVGCPTTSGAARGFRGANPALFSSSGFGVHPYPFFQPPTRADSRDPDFVEFNEIPRFASSLDRLLRIYGSRRHLAIYNTEYGYETNPPNHSQPFVSPTTASYYINWAEYISWRNPRLASTMQFLLIDPNASQGASFFGAGGFAAGLYFSNGTPKADAFAYRMPIYLPSASTRRGRSLEVWGAVRPAIYARGTQRAQIQLQRGRGAFKTVATVRLRNARGYFDVKVKFPASGNVRVAWRADSRTPFIYSRSSSIRIR